MAKTNLFTGFHAVEEQVKAAAADKRVASSMHIYYSTPGPRVKKILAEASSYGIRASRVEKTELDAMAGRLPDGARDHRGIVLERGFADERASNTVDFDVWLEEFKIAEAASDGEEKRRAVVLVLDSITDVHNFGAILRSAEQFGVSLVVAPVRRSAGGLENEVVARTSAGASSWIKFSAVPNLTRAVRSLKEAGFWVYGADAQGVSVSEGSFDNKTVLVLGSEGSGIGKHLREECDALVSIPTCGRIDSLNVSVAAGILLYEIYRQSIQVKNSAS